eukprot:SAG22_NODE_305_length_12688_cov_24.723330_3_plen_72_part_00
MMKWRGRGRRRIVNSDPASNRSLECTLLLVICVNLCGQRKPDVPGKKKEKPCERKPEMRRRCCVYAARGFC